MLGNVYLFDTKLNKTIRTYKSKELYDNNNYEFRLKIKSDYLDKYNNRYILICACNRSIELSIDSIGRIYHKNKVDVLKHDRFCERHKDYKNNISKGITTKDDKTFINLNFNIIPNNKARNAYSKENTESSMNIQDLSKHLNILASKYHTSNKFEMLNKAFYLSKDLYIKGFKDKTLQDFYFNIKDYKKITANTPKFVYMYISEIKNIENPDYLQLKCEYSNEKSFSFIIKKELFEKQYLSKYIDKIKNPILISGFIHKSELGLEFYQVSLLKVNKDGIY